MSLRVRLCLPTRRHRPATDTRSTIPIARRPISRQMAFLPPLRHARARLRPLLAVQLHGPPKWHQQGQRADPVTIRAKEVLLGVWILRSSDLDLQHDFPHER